MDITSLQSASMNILMIILDYWETTVVVEIFAMLFTMTIRICKESCKITSTEEFAGISHSKVFP
jgi:hypothetical protein